MGLEDLTDLEILQSSLVLIFVIISLILGFRILFKYFSVKRIELITVGLTWILMSSAWWGPSISFILIVLFDFGLNQFTYLFIGTVFLPISLICWIYSFCHMAYPHLKKKIVSTYVVILVIYEIFLIIFLLIDPEIVGTMEGSVNARHNLFTVIFDILVLGTCLITALILARILMKSEEPSIRLKGWFLAIGITSLTIGGLLDAALTMNAITLVLVRILLISSAIEYYLAFLHKITETEDFEQESIGKKDEFQEFIEMIARHKHKPLTEEEITFYKEQKICLVCKGKISRLNYICPNCDALYCVKCSEALSNLENACWVCNEPFDESKPYKPFKKVEEEVEIDISEKPQKKPKTSKKF